MMMIMVEVGVVIVTGIVIRIVIVISIMTSICPGGDEGQVIYII